MVRLVGDDVPDPVSISDLICIRAAAAPTITVPLYDLLDATGFTFILTKPLDQNTYTHTHTRTLSSTA